MSAITPTDTPTPTPTTTQTWTPERIAQLKIHFEAGLSCRQIADDIGVTRNAVIGKLSRLNLMRREPRPVVRSTPRTEPRSHRVPRITQRQLLRPLREEEPIEPFAEITLEHRCSLLDLTEDKCRWPIGEIDKDMWYCGSKAAKGLPYCAGHARMAYHRTRRY